MLCHQNIEEKSIRDNIEASEQTVFPLGRITQCKLTEKQHVSVSDWFVRKLDQMHATYIAAI